MEYNRQKNIMKKLLVVMCVIFGLTINVNAKDKPSYLKNKFVCAKEGFFYTDTIPNIVIPDSLTFSNTEGTYYYIGYQWAFLFQEFHSMGANLTNNSSNTISSFEEVTLDNYYVQRLYYIYAWKFNENTTFFVARRWNGIKWETSLMIENPHKQLDHRRTINQYDTYFYDYRVKYRYMILDKIHDTRKVLGMSHTNIYYPFINL